MRKIIIITLVILLGSMLGALSLGSQEIAYEEPSLPKVSAPPLTESLVFGALQGNINYLDPHYAYDQASFNVINQVVEQLYQFNISDPNLPIIPWLAADMPTISPNGTEYTITLRQGILFHDNYTFNATAVKWSFDRLCYFLNYSGNADLPAPFNVPLPDYIFPTQLDILYIQPDGKRVINKTEILGPYQIKITLNAPKGSFISLLCFPGSGILSPLSTPPNDYYQLSDTLVGTGPFIYKSFTVNAEVRFEGNPDYWGTPENTGPPKLDTLIYVIVPDSTTLMYGMLAGDFDIIDQVGSSLIPAFQADPNIFIDNFGNTLTIEWTTFNVDHINLTMRKALSWCYNYTYAVDVIYSGQALRLQSPIPQGIPYSNYSLEYPVQDRATARNYLLTDPYWGPICTARGLDASSTDNDWISIARINPIATYNCAYNIGNNIREGFANRLAYDAEYIGVEVTSFGEVFSDYLDMIQSHRDWFDMYSLGWRPDFPDPENYINPIYDADTALNGGNFNETDVQALMDAGLIESDPVAREAIYQEIQRLLVEVYYPAMWQVSRVNYDAWQTYVHGWVPNPIERVWFYPVYLTDIAPPSITISSPTPDQLFGLNAPYFSITVDDKYPINSTWYTIDGGLTNYTFSGLIGTINQTAWNNEISGPITLRFYANDSSGNVGFADVNIIKDIDAPIITIISPIADESFVSAPAFSLTINEANLGSNWYIVEGSTTQYSFTGLTGTINQNAWDNAPEGDVTITFYAQDELGLIGTKNVTVIKSLPPGPISGYNVLVISGVFFVTLVIITQKRKLNLKK